MITSKPLSEKARNAYPGEYIPEPYLLRSLDDKTSRESFNTKKSLFSQVTIFEDQEYYKIELETPGLARKDLLVRINDRGNLFVAGMHKTPQMLGKPDIFTETYSGFSRELSLPENIDTDFIKAECRFGVLSIWFLKTGHPYPKRPSLVVVY